jgi:hypothetical protein
LFFLARLLGIAASGLAAVLWLVMLLANPYQAVQVTRQTEATDVYVGHPVERPVITRMSDSAKAPRTYAMAALMIGLSCFGAVSAWKARPLRMTVAAAVSFVPVGFYALGTPGIFRFIGVSNLLLLLAAVALHESRNRAAMARKPLPSQAAK